MRLSSIVTTPAGERVRITFLGSENTSLSDRWDTKDFTVVSGKVPRETAERFKRIAETEHGSISAALRHMITTATNRGSTI